LPQHDPGILYNKCSRVWHVVQCCLLRCSTNSIPVNQMSWIYSRAFQGTTSLLSL
jgi:hypothetical protein